MATTGKSVKSTKSTTAKKPAAKTAVKKPAAKPAAKAPAKKPAVKTAVKKLAAKSAAKAPAKKPAVKTAVKKPAAKAPVKKTTMKAPAMESAATGLRVMDLFDAYAQDKLPRDHGYIVSAFFSMNSAYSIYEVVSYSGVKEIRLGTGGLEFVTGGKKLFVLVEPASYPLKYQEPVSRKEGELIPKRFSELEKITDRKQNSIYVAKEPNDTFGSFTILKPTGDNFARVLYNLSDVYETLRELFEKSFNQEAGIPQGDARIAATLVSRMVETTMSFKGEFA
ncbi:MAG: hypothetical protein LBK62_05395 [Treponema sp.]|jgi:hypothetical protein|nr:hypothetical protein [Treponema sp.]